MDKNILKEIEDTKTTIANAMAQAEATIKAIQKVKDIDQRLAAADMLVATLGGLEKIQSILRRMIHSLRQPKFIMQMDPEHVEYLQWESAENRMHRSQLIRTYIDQSMLNNRKYQKYLKSKDN